jgi:DNA repair protein RadD
VEEVGGLAVDLRPYQVEALQALDAYWEAGGGHPLAVLATATGKSVLIAKLITDIAARFVGFRVLVLVHVRELVEQSLAHLLRVWPAAPVGINSAGLGRRNWDAPIVLANIQSVWRNPQRLGRRHLVIVDEAQLVPHAGYGMYRSLIERLRALEPAMRVCGFTATPFRLDSGRLDHGDGKIFDDVVFEYGIAEGIRDGWLAPLTSKATGTGIDVSSVAVRGGDFVAGGLENVADDAAVVNAAVDEIITRGRGRRSWLLFCCGVRHACHVSEALSQRGVAAAAVTADTPRDRRDAIVDAFRCGDIRGLTNVNILTTGFDVPAVDLIAMLRPTLSTGLYVQMVGRGTRKAEGKYDCLVLDFAGNVRRHGPIDRAAGVNGNGGHTGVKADAVSAKSCPECSELNALRDAVCSCCGHEFPHEKPKPKHASVADWTPILCVTDFLQVTEVSFRLHIKFSNPTAPPSLRVEFLCGLSPYTEYVSLERQGYAREVAERWWFAMGGRAPVPSTVAQALQRTDELDTVIAITVARNGKFWNVVEKRVRRPDGSKIDINRWGRCVVAREHQPPVLEPMNDEVLF